METIFRTAYSPSDQRRGIINHGRPVLLMGSCFSDNVGQRLARDGFDVMCNPTGVLYNPVSIVESLSMAGRGAAEAERGLYEYEGVWHHPMFHSSFSSKDRGAAAGKIREALGRLARMLRRNPVVVLTFGTAWVYYDQGGRVVANCHKLPASRFTRRRLSVDECAAAMRAALDKLPGCDVLATVSPIRHLADGFEGNSLSKATLRLAIEQAGLEYFPAYEILMDDLRDYRFYAADMKHPSEVAADYVYDLFTRSYCTTRTADEAARRRRLWLRSQHHPLVE